MALLQSSHIDPAGLRSWFLHSWSELFVPYYVIFLFYFLFSLVLAIYSLLLLSMSLAGPLG